VRLLKWLDKHFEETLLVVISTVMVSVIFVQVVMRTLGHSLSWSEELGRYCFIWLIYIGISYGVKKQRHIKVDVIMLLLNEKSKIVLNVISNLFFLGFCALAVWYGTDIAVKLLNFGQKSPALQIPMGLVYMAAPIGLGLSAIRIIQNLIMLIKSWNGNVDFKVLTELERIQENPER
jgi:TRAP-type C4-dicarboxylate transport system permease small subunit